VVARERAQNAHTSVTKMIAARRADRRVGRPRPGVQGCLGRVVRFAVLGRSAGTLQRVGTLRAWTCG